MPGEDDQVVYPLKTISMKEGECFGKTIRELEKYSEGNGMLCIKFTIKSLQLV